MSLNQSENQNDIAANEEIPQQEIALGHSLFIESQDMPEEQVTQSKILAVKRLYIIMLALKEQYRDDMGETFGTVQCKS